MEKTTKVATVLVLAVVLCFASVGVAEALGPIWKIYRAGTNQSINWRTHGANPRFAKWKAGTNGDPSDDIVLDRETGLVWEREPMTTTMTWYAACDHCQDLEKGNKMGWRLPSLEELSSLIDPNEVNPALPDDNPFLQIVNNWYWTISTRRSDVDDCYELSLATGSIAYGEKTGFSRVICVRGGTGYDANH